MSGQSYSLSYNVDVKANASSVKKLMSDLQNVLNGLTLPKGLADQFAQEFNKFGKEMAKYDASLLKGMPTDKKTMNQSNSSWSNIEASVLRVQQLMNTLGNMPGLQLVSKDAQAQIDGANKALEEYQQKIQAIRDSKGYKELIEGKKDASGKKTSGIADYEGEIHDIERRIRKYRSALSDATSEKMMLEPNIAKFMGGDPEKILSQYEDISARLARIKGEIRSGKDVSGENDLLKTLGINPENTDQAISRIEQLQRYVKTLNDVSGNETRVAHDEGLLQQQVQRLEALKLQIQNFEQGQSAEPLQKLISSMSELTGIPIEKFGSSLEQVKQTLESFTTSKITEGANSFKNAEANANGLRAATEKAAAGQEKLNQAFSGFMTKEQDMANFKHRFSYFFSLTGITQTVRRVFRDVTTTIKELDSVMTETAVVTDFTVSDMWDKLPEYTKKASQLGTSIASLYEATTLYYQQGLGDQAAMDLGVETMKMARIANMDAADATQAMTAALRGFNMEINETSATRVNDVYSELAAITAADTEQIATAMTKTASIASSANMEFETTAAFLAQIIETTQEAPETAGTAMKTIIARFTEVKKLFSKGMLSGEDEEGEAIEINKIDKALQSVGISLKSFLRGEKGIDDIFLELASKWDTLDLATQRYIATTAAGSRQQSRFIAMMSDYGRTMELVDAAQNSSGASQEQFDKTLDSLSSKMERLKNAWHEFTMGIIDSDLVKIGVDMLTKLLETVNKITNAFGKVGSPLAKIGIIMGGFKLGRGLFMRSTPGQKMVKDGWMAPKMGGQIGSFRDAKIDTATKLGMYPNNTQYSVRQMGLFGPKLNEIQSEYNKQLAQNQADQVRIKSQIDTFKEEQNTTQRLKEAAQKHTATVSNMKQVANARANQARMDYENGLITEQERDNKIAEDSKIVAAAEKQASSSTEKYKKSLEKTKDNTKKITEAEEELNKKREEGEQIADKKAQLDTLKRQQGYAIGSAVGTGLMLTGMTTGLLSQVAQKNGNEQLAEGLSVVSTVATAAGVGLQSLVSIASALGASLISVIAVAAAVVAALAAIAGVAYLIYRQSDKGQIDAAEKKTKAAEEDAARSKEKYERLDSYMNELQARRESIEDMKKGSKEWREAVTSLNEDTSNLIEEHSELANFASWKDGILTLDATNEKTVYDSQGNVTYQTLQSILREQQRDSLQAENAAIQSKIDETQLKLDLNLDDYLEDLGVEGFAGHTGATALGGAIYSQERTAEGGDDETYFKEGILETKMTQQLAELIATGAISSIEEAEKWIASHGTGEKKGTKKYSAKLTEETFEDLRSYGYYYMGENFDIDASKKQQADNLKSVAELYGANTDFVQGLSSKFISGFVDQMKEEGRDYKEITEDDARRYASLMGLDEDLIDIRNRKVVFGTGSEKAKVSKEDIRKKLVQADAEMKSALSLQGIEAKIKTENLEDFQKLLSEDGEGILGQDFAGAFKDLIHDDNKDGYIEAKELFTRNEDGTLDFTGDADKLAQTYSKNAATFEEWAEELNIDAEVLANVIQENLEDGANRIKKERKDLAQKMAKYSSGEYSRAGEGYEIMAQTLTGYEARFGDAGREMMAEVMNSLEASGDENLISSGWSKFMALSLEMTQKEAQGLADTISGINWANPIEATKQVNQQLEKGSGASREFAAHIKESNTSFFGLGSQMRYLLEGSEELEGMSESLDEIIKQNGEISASDIYDLTDEYKSLKDIMDNTGASAGALAEVLEKVQIGDLGIHQVTDAVIAAIDQIDGLASMIAGLEKDFSSFDPGIDENFASSFIAQASETFKTNLDKGAVGNSQLDSYMDYLIGEDWDKNLGKEERTAKLKTAGKFFEQNSENMSSAWTDMSKLLSGQSVEGLLGQTYTGTDLGFDITRDSSTGEIIMSGYDHLSWNEMAANMSKTFGVTERMAKALLTDFANYSGDLALLEKQRESSVEDVSKEALAKGAEIGGKKTLDQSEIDAIAKLTGLEAGEISKYVAAQGGVVTNFYDEYGQVKTGKDAWEEYSKVSGDKLDKFTTESSESYQRNLEAIKNNPWMSDWDKDQAIATLDDTKLFDMATLEDDLAKSGLSEAVQEQIKAGALSAFTDDLGRATEEYEVQARMSDGTLKNIKVEAGQTFEEAYNQADLKLQNDMLSQSLAEAIINAGTDLDAITPTVDTEGIQNQLNSKTYTISVNGVVSVSGGDADSGGGASGPNRYQGQKPHIGPSYASGLSSAKRPHAALTGELGPELIWRRSQNQFYLAGMNGPEMTTVNPADTVFTAEETKQILNQPDGPKMPGFAKGLSGPSYASAYKGATSGGKDTSSKDSKAWENPFDKLYNLLRKIDEELRERERIERRYEKLLEDLGVSANKIIDISREELLQLEKERKLQEKLVEGRREQIKLYQEEKAELTKYANVTQNERGEDVLRIDWDLIDSVEDTEEGKSIEEYVKQLEEWFDSLTEAEDALWEIEDTIEEIKERGEDEYFDLEEAIKDALEQSYQDQIDKLEDINDAINDTNAELLEGIQKSIEKTRQDRENEKTEEELSDKQRRLSYLQMDTSGSNATEILTLQKELEEGQENYTDTLIDQKISELQEQNDEAAKQREKQIDLLQAQLDHYLETGRIWDEVYQLMDDGLDKDSGLVRGSHLEEILKNEENFAGLSAIGKQEWWVDMDKKVASALAYLEVGRQIENLGVKNKEIEFYTEDGKKLKGKVDDKGNVTIADGKVYNNVYQGANGLYYAGKNYETPKEPKVEGVGKGTSGSGKESGSGSGKGSGSGEYRVYYADYNGTRYYGNKEGEAVMLATAARNRDVSVAANAAMKKGGSKPWEEVVTEISSRPITKGSYLVPYKTGGLADFTGPAWLDGTKSRPELVLNQRDTQNFIQLKDILSSLFSHNLGNSTSTENNGDITYDIDINVESIGSDYDVDKVASRVKTLITEDARYRNNNVIGLKR